MAETDPIERPALRRETGQAPRHEAGAARARLRWWLWTAGPLVAALSGLAVFLGAPAEAASGIIALGLLPVLALGVFGAVHHADVIAHRTGEPYGTLVLTVAVTVIEVALILSIMAAGEGNAALARDTVFAVVMIVLNGLVGLCLIAGGLMHREQGFRLPAANSYFVVLMPLAVLTLVLPSFTTSAAGPYYSTAQLIFVSLVTLLLYAVFLYVQTVRHRDFFLSDSGGSGGREKPAGRRVAASVALLALALVAVVLLSKPFAVSFMGVLSGAGAPAALTGLIVAAIVLLPESVAAIRAARANELQKSLNLALGSSLATIGLTIPAVAALSLALGLPLALGLGMREIVLLVLTFAVCLVTFDAGRTNILPGFVHLVLFATYVFLIFAP
jgi:Ca2+:H+ antiporter